MVFLVGCEFISQVINEVLANVWIVIDQLALQDHPVFISPVSECMTGLTYLAVGITST